MKLFLNRLVVNTLTVFYIDNPKEIFMKKILMVTIFALSPIFVQAGDPICNVMVNDLIFDSEGNGASKQTKLPSFVIPRGDSEFRLNVSDKEQGYDSLEVKCNMARRSQWEYAAEVSCRAIVNTQNDRGYTMLLTFSGQNNVGGSVRLNLKKFLSIHCSPFNSN